MIYMWVFVNLFPIFFATDVSCKKIVEFNNKFLVYSGQNIEKEVIYNLLDLSGLNMEKYEETGKDSFKVYLSQGTNNMSLSQEIKNKIEKSSKIFNVNFGFNSEGKVNSIEIYGYDKQQ